MPLGEVAEAMLDGTLCAYCGCVLGIECGFPIYCNECKPDDVVERPRGRHGNRKRRHRNKKR